MADPTQVDRLRRDVEEWNTWRRQHPKTAIDLSEAHLRGADLSYANLSGANLSGADLSYADLSYANLLDARLLDARLLDARLLAADLSDADLSGAHLSDANLSGANLSGANLSGVDLRFANLRDADLSDATIGDTSFGDRDFRQIKGLDTIRHRAGSPLSINSIYLSEGGIPEAFVRGTGAPDNFLEYMHALAAHPIEYYTCFISYSSKDQAFAERLYTDLQHNGVRCWYAPHSMRIGDEIRTRIDDSIRMYDKLLLVLSQHAIASSWVKKEVETAFEKEDQHGKLVLFPVKLDATVMETQQAWAADIRRMRHIGDFIHWKDHDAYQLGLQRLLDDLKQKKA